MTFKEKIESNHFLWCGELGPPQNCDADTIRKKTNYFKGDGDAEEADQRVFEPGAIAGILGVDLDIQGDRVDEQLAAAMATGRDYGSTVTDPSWSTVTV